MNYQQTATPESDRAILKVQNVLELCAEDMARIDECIRDSLDSHVVLINQVAVP